MTGVNRGKVSAAACGQVTIGSGLTLIRRMVSNRVSLWLVTG